MTAILVSALPLTAAWAFEANQDVLVQKDGVFVRGWVVRPDGDQRSLVAYNWDAGNMEMVDNSRIRENHSAPMDPAKKAVTGWTSGEIGLWHLSAALSGNYLVAGSGSGEIQLFEQGSLYPLRTFPKLKQVSDLALSPDGAMLATCQYSGEVQLFRSADGHLIKQLKPGLTCEHVAFGAAHKLAVVGSPLGQKGNQALWIYDPSQHQLSAPQFSYSGVKRNLASLSFSPDGQVLAVGTANRELGVRLYALQGTQLKALKTLPSNGDVYALSFSSDGQYLAAGSGDNKVSLWKWQSGQRFWAVPWQAPGSSVSYLAFAPDGQSIAACGSGSGDRVHLYRFGNGQVERKLGAGEGNLGCTGLAYSADGTSLFLVRQINSNFGEVVLQRYLLP